MFNNTISVAKIHRGRTAAGECATVVDCLYTGKVDLPYRTRRLGLHFLVLRCTAYAEVLSYRTGPAGGSTAPVLVQNRSRQKGQCRQSWEQTFPVCLCKKNAAVGWDWESHVCSGFLFSTAPSENSNLFVTPGKKPLLLKHYPRLPL